MYEGIKTLPPQINNAVLAVPATCVPLFSVFISAASDQDVPLYCSKTSKVKVGSDPEALPPAAAPLVCDPPPPISDRPVFKLPPDDQDPAFTTGSSSLVCNVTPFISLYVAIINSL